MTHATPAGSFRARRTFVMVASAAPPFSTRTASPCDHTFRLRSRPRAVTQPCARTVNDRTSPGRTVMPGPSKVTRNGVRSPGSSQCRACVPAVLRASSVPAASSTPAVMSTAAGCVPAFTASPTTASRSGSPLCGRNATSRAPRTCTGTGVSAGGAARVRVGTGRNRRGGRTVSCGWALRRHPASVRRRSCQRVSSMFPKAVNHVRCTCAVAVVPGRSRSPGGAPYVTDRTSSRSSFAYPVRRPPTTDRSSCQRSSVRPACGSIRR